MIKWVKNGQICHSVKNEKGMAGSPIFIRDGGECLVVDGDHKLDCICFVGEYIILLP